jgi:alanine-synthesizing transaminase
VVFSDEIYDRMLFDGLEHISTATISEEACVLTLNGLSKNWVTPGWRIGWGVLSGPPKKLQSYSEAIQKLERARLCANHPEQHAIRPALEGDQSHLGELVRELTVRRDKTVSMLNAIEGISCVAPRGAFYAFPRLEIDMPDAEWVARLIRETGVVVVPGSGFGQRPGTNHFRIVTLPPIAQLEEAYRRIGEFMAGL